MNPFATNGKKAARWRAVFGFLPALLLLAAPSHAQSGAVSATALRQIEAVAADKAGRTAAQQKMDSQLIYAARESRNQFAVLGVPNLKSQARMSADGRVLVDIRAFVNADLLRDIVRVGGQVLNAFPASGAIRALLPAASIESVATRADVRFIGRAVRAKTLREYSPHQVTAASPQKAMRLAQLFDAESVGASRDGFKTSAGQATSQGDSAHRADQARASYGVDGSGIKIGVLSDGVSSLSKSIASGDLPADTVVLSGQAGSGDEGTAMLEIVHDLAPGAKLYFATADYGPANFANNIRSLRAAGCNIIIDDVLYFNESPFQADVIEKAVADVSASGALYFSAAANSGNKDDGTSGTWRGDFRDGGASGAIFSKVGRLHDFGGATSDLLTNTDYSDSADFFWNDPLGASTNDYDVYALNNAGVVVASSTTTQNGFQDPYEYLSGLRAGDRIVVVKTGGAANRFLHLATEGATLAINTDGSTRGHNAAAVDNAFSVAATYAGGNAPFLGGAQNPVETFSSDGPRRLYFNADGTAITPGNFSSSGGRVLAKPDVTAADGVSTTVPSFTRFYGTSAAAPHAGAIAALVWSYNLALSPAQVRAALQSSATDIEAPGVDRDSGAGILNALAALAAAPQPDRSPIARDDEITVAKDAARTTAEVLNNDYDPRGYAITVTAVTQPQNGSATLSGGQVRYQPDAGFSGTDSFSYSISNGHGGTASAVVNVTVTGVANVAPVANAGSDQTLILDGKTVKVQLDGSASRGADSDKLSYQWRENGAPLAQDVKPKIALGIGTHVITLQVSDGKATGSDSVIINVIAPPPSYKVSGSGTITVGAIFNGKSKAPQNIGKLQVSVASKKGVASGSVSFDDKLSGLSIRLKNIASLEVNGNVATITGMAKVSGQSALQNTVVIVTDVSAKGSGDLFSIQSGNYQQGGALTQGNLTIAQKN